MCYKCCCNSIRHDSLNCFDFFSEFTKTTAPVTLDSEFPAKVEVDVNNDFQPSDQSSLEKEGKLN